MVSTFQIAFFKASSWIYLNPDAYSETSRTPKMEKKKAKKLHLRYSTGFWKCLWITLLSPNSSPTTIFIREVREVWCKGFFETKIWWFSCNNVKKFHVFLALDAYCLLECYTFLQKVTKEVRLKVNLRENTKLKWLKPQKKEP